MKPQDLENVLRERLGPSAGRPLPSPGFDDRLRLSLTPRGAGDVTRRRRRYALEALVGIAAVLALSVVALPWLVGPRSGAGPAPGGSASPSETASAPTLAPTPTPVPLAHAQKWFLAFDYPAAWTLDDQSVLDVSGAYAGLRFSSAGGNLLALGRSVGFLGAGSARDVCQGDPNNVECTTEWTLPEGSVEVRFWVASGTRWDGVSAIDGYPLAGYNTTTVDGLPAMFAKSTGSISNAALVRPAETVPNADEVLSWVLPTQRELGGVYTIDAAIRGPNTVELESQVRAMIASLRWEPAAYRLPTDPAALETAQAAAIKSGLSSLRSYPTAQIFTSGYPKFFDCFPSKAGVKVAATITHSQQAPLTRPLPVTCTTAIEPNSMQGWTLSLTQTWAAGSDYPAGYCTNVYQLHLDGRLAASIRPAPTISNTCTTRTRAAAALAETAAGRGRRNPSKLTAAAPAVQSAGADNGGTCGDAWFRQGPVIGEREPRLVSRPRKKEPKRSNWQQPVCFRPRCLGSKVNVETASPPWAAEASFSGGAVSGSVA